MGIAFWRKTREIGPDNAQSVPATEDTPLPVTPYQTDEDDALRVQIDQKRMPPVAGETRLIGPIQVPGIGTASAYTAGDAFGGLIRFHDCFRPEKCSGTIVGAFLIDPDDEGIGKDLPIFVQAITITTDNSPYAIADADLQYGRGFVQINSFFDGGNGQIGQASKTTVPLWVKADGPDLWTQLRTTGADNIAAGSLPWVGLLVVPD